MSAPTSWTDLDWDKAHPLDYRYMQSLWAAVAERRHVVRRPDAYKRVPNGYHYAPSIYRGPGQPPSREEFVALRDAIYHLCDGLVGNREGRFLKLDYDYAKDDDGWNAWPVYWTREQLTAPEERNISWMPDASVYAPAWGEWMRRAKACLDVMVASLSPAWWSAIKDPAIWATKHHEGISWNLYENATLAAAIADAKADEETIDYRAPWPSLYFDFRRYRQTNPSPPPPDLEEYYLAWFMQSFEWRIMNTASIKALPRLVGMLRGQTNDYDYFDGFGYFRLGANVVEPGGSETPPRLTMNPGEIVLIDDDDSVLEPVVLPDLEQPDPGQYNQATAICDLGLYFDYRCPGGFQFYTPEPEE